MESKLPRSTPRQERIDPSAILSLIETFEKEGFNTHSLMVVRNGKVVAETWWQPYRKNENHLLYSLTKSFASTAVGFAVNEGMFSLDDLVVDLLPQQAPAETSENLSKMKVRHLLSMSVGHEVEPNLYPSEGTWDSCAKRFLAHPVPFEPGTHFLYNTAASNMLSILVQNFSGETLDIFLNKRLFGALGIMGEKWTWGKDFVWGGSGLHTTTESIAKLGILYLNGGRWEGHQLLPPGWAEEATRSHVPNGSDPNNDWNQGYGLQFWRCRHDSFRGDGAFGQFCIVIPEKQVVIAITSGDSPMQKVLDSIWNILLPAFDQDIESTVEIGLERDLLPSNTPAHPTAIDLTSEAENFEFKLGGHRDHLRLFGEVPVSLAEWVEFDYNFGRVDQTPARAKAAWISADTLLLEVCNIETPQDHRFEIKADGRVTFSERGVFAPLESKTIFADARTPA